MTDHITKLSSELDVFRGRGGLFDVPITEMDANIGRRCRFIAPGCLIEQEMFTIATVQRNYRGDLVYRVVADSDPHRFGRCAHPSEICFIESDPVSL